jgi:FtsP/CotA-like multicopper oxidase with cupredoxin domain
MTDYTDKDRTIQKRREFIKLSAAGVVGSLAACAAPGTQREAAPAATAPEPESVPDRGLSKVEPVPPEVGNLVDPELLPAETWQEPWTWRSEEWSGDSLELNVVGNQSPGPSPSPGNPNPSLFSFNGISPGPTVRVRNDGELLIRVRNLLGKNHGEVPVGPVPDFFDLPPDIAQDICTLAGQPPEEDGTSPSCFVPVQPKAIQQITGHDQRPNWDIGGHINGVHAAHTTNLHTHGLHVSPGTNPDGSHSDNVFLRIIPQADFAARKTAHGPDAEVLLENEHVGQLDYRYQLSFERDGRRMPHPPGTHWYHPHAHGSTHDQVASGMAGYLIVEGDVDEAINTHMTDEPWPDPAIPNGPFDYRERLVFLQRAFTQSFDNAAPPKKQSLRTPPIPSADDARPPPVFRMRPGAVERWRVLNGSVDGAGTKRFMVLEGQFMQRADRIWRVRSAGEGNDRKRWLEQVTEQDYENSKADLQLLSMDGITLVREEKDKAKHWIKDLSKQNAGSENPIASPMRAGENEITRWLRAYESAWKDGDSLRRAFVRPNELYLTNANRADVFFKAPLHASGKVFTVLAKEAHLHNDHFQRRLQGRAQNPNFGAQRDLFDVVVGYIHVTGEPVEGGDFDIQSLNSILPPVPPLLLPVTERELRVPETEASLTDVKPGSLRTRTISYSGMGGNTFPVHAVPRQFAEQHPELEKLTWSVYEGVPILLQNLTASMGINTEFDLTFNPEPMAPRKFGHHDPYRSRMLVNTAEEWVLYNSSMMLWGHTDLERLPQPGSYNNRFRSYPMTRSEGQQRYAQDPEFMITVRATDHPFHIHVNPMWVLRIDVPDENGELHNILPEPTWMDTVAIPRNGGRVVFRSRFDDFVGTWVNHCHILLHEDNGMMQAVECTDDARQVNYRPRRRAASHEMSGAEVDAIYPKPTLEIMYRQNIKFVDPSDVGGYEFPGFEFEVPRLDEA